VPSAAGYISTGKTADVSLRFFYFSSNCWCNVVVFVYDVLYSLQSGREKKEKNNNYLAYM